MTGLLKLLLKQYCRTVHKSDIFLVSVSVHTHILVVCNKKKIFFRPGYIEVGKCWYSWFLKFQIEQYNIKIQVVEVFLIFFGSTVPYEDFLKVCVFVPGCDFKGIGTQTAGDSLTDLYPLNNPQI